ncbi:unnamed protein product [Durusdinium trenchii]|uniref:G domain-containing protein n=1 Tax=Durusdinium trenchii TaxID=1381693 RepID=A0ABP0M9C4_9DINO
MGENLTFPQWEVQLQWDKLRNLQKGEVFEQKYDFAGLEVTFQFRRKDKVPSLDIRSIFEVLSSELSSEIGGDIAFRCSAPVILQIHAVDRPQLGRKVSVRQGNGLSGSVPASVVCGEVRVFVVRILEIRGMSIACRIANSLQQQERAEALQSKCAELENQHQQDAQTIAKTQKRAEALQSKCAELEKQHYRDAQTIHQAENQHQQDTQTIVELQAACAACAQLEEQHQRDAQTIAQLEKQHQEDAAELKRLNAIVGETENQAADRTKILVNASVKIQSKWRSFLQQQRLQRDSAEQDRRNRRLKVESAIASFQRLWRLRQKRRQRRWQLAQSMETETTPYDAILAVTSLAEFLSTREIKFLQKAESHFEIAKESRYRILAVVGLFDKGKTWLINKLFGVKLASGKLCTTKGLSFLWIKERRMLVLDSAGVQSTVSYRAQAVDAIHDAQTTESLMFEMVSRIAHHMVFVVNDLTWFEQKHVAMLHQKYVQSKQHKELIVVHNLRNTTDVQEARKLFQRQVMLCYDGEPSHLGQLIFTADAGEGAPPVHHVGLCHEFSVAGEAFNSKNRDYLLQSLEHGNTLGSNIVLTDLLCAELSRLLPKFVSIDNTEPEASESTPCPMLFVKFKSRAENADTHVESEAYAPLGSMCIHLSPEKAHLSTKTRGVISPLGEIIAHDVSFDPNVNVFDKSISAGIQRYIRVECPGVVDDDIQWEELPNGVKITINKKPPIEEHSVHPVQPIRQHHGVWEREFLFDHSDGRFELCEEEAELEAGVLTMVLRKTLQPRKGKLQGKARARASYQASDNH